MVRPVNLLPASFRGVPFLVPSDETEEGPRTVEHEYPGSGVRYNENLGYCPPRFDLTIVLADPGVSGKLAALRNALNVEAPGTLMHPVFGAQLVSVVGPYRISRDQQSAGIIELSVTFSVTASAPPIGASGASRGSIASLGLAALSAAVSVIRSQWEAPRSPYSREKLQKGFEDHIQAFGAFQRSSEVAGAMADASKGVAGALDDAEALAGLMAAVYRSPMDDTSIDGDGLYGGYLTVSDGIDDIVSEMTPTGFAITSDQSARARSITAFRDAARLSSLATMCVAIAEKRFKTADDVLAAESALSNMRAWLSEADTISMVTASAIDAVYATTMSMLSEESRRLPSIAALSVIEMPASVLGYQLYEGDEGMEALVEINAGRNPILYDGEVNVLTQ